MMRPHSLRRERITLLFTTVRLTKDSVEVLRAVVRQDPDPQAPFVQDVRGPSR